MAKLKVNEKAAKQVEVDGKVYTVYKIVYENKPKWLKGYSVSELGGWATKDAAINDNCFIGENVYIIGNSNIWASHIEGAENKDNSLYIIDSNIDNCTFDLQGVIKSSTLMFLNNSANVLRYNGVFIGTDVNIEKSVIKNTEILCDGLKIKNSEIEFSKLWWDGNKYNIEEIKNLSILNSTLCMCEVRVDNIKVTNSKLKGRYISKNIKGAAESSLEEI